MRCLGNGGGGRHPSGLSRVYLRCKRGGLQEESGPMIDGKTPVTPEPLPEGLRTIDPSARTAAISAVELLSHPDQRSGEGGDRRRRGRGSGPFSEPSPRGGQRAWVGRGEITNALKNLLFSFSTIHNVAHKLQQAPPPQVLKFIRCLCPDPAAPRRSPGGRPATPGRRRSAAGGSACTRPPSSGSVPACPGSSSSHPGPSPGQEGGLGAGSWLGEGAGRRRKPTL